MADKFAVIEIPSVSKRRENTLAIINEHPKKVYDNKKALQAIHEITKFINSHRTESGRAYEVKFKLYKDEDNSLYEAECNRILSSPEECAKEFETLNDFAKWYKDYAQKIIKEIKNDAEVQKYRREALKTPHK